MRSWACVAFAVVSLLVIACSGDDAGAGGSGGDGGSSGDPVLDDARQYNLTRINAYRQMAGSPPLHLDGALNEFAQEGSVELSMDHAPHQHFKTSYATCNCGVNAENQGDANGWTVAPIHDQIDQILQLMMSEGPGGGHYDNIMNAQFTRLGVGIVNPSAALYFTNDFGP
jgi:hypothetical protein